MKYALQVMTMSTMLCATSLHAMPAVSYQGSLKSVHQGDFKASLSLDELTQSSGLQGLGPVAHMDGEITILDGQMTISQVRNGAIQTIHTWDNRAAFLVWSTVKAWQPGIPLQKNLKNLADLDQHIADLAQKAGLNINEPFPFKLEGHAHHVEYHVLNGVDDAGKPINGARATSFSVGHTDGIKVIGFYSTQHEGIFTHKYQHTHLHVLLPDNSSGHIDEAHFPKNKMKVFFPML